MGICASAVADGFVQPTQQKLDDLGPGCFVQKMGSNGSCCWVEITSMGSTEYDCIAHPALLSDTGRDAVSEGDHLKVKRDQITALGCDRYCSC